MSLSEDDDDFLSADEDQFDDNEAASSTSVADADIVQLKDLTRTPLEQEAKVRVIQVEEETNFKKSAEATATLATKPVTTDTSQLEARQELEDDVKQPSQASSSSGDGEPEDSQTQSKEDSVRSTGDERDGGGPGDEEETLAEKIRERNIKLARKFSAELAKNVQASAPIPVMITTPIGIKSNDLDDPNIPYSDLKGSLPPAPPPTPALTSSFNAEEHANNWPTSQASTSQYSWRVPTKNQKSSPSMSSAATAAEQAQQTPNPDGRSDSKSEQARLALDKLSDNFFSNNSEKNLFEQVAEDLKKVSIKTENPGTKVTNLTDSIPLISDLGSSLSGWNWNSASKLFASASQVTSQVGSVLDTVVNASHQLHQSTSAALSSAAMNRETKIEKSD